MPARRTRPILLTLALLAAGCAAVPPAPAGPPATLSIRGKITADMLDQLAVLVPPGEVPARAVVYLASGGGEFHTALKIAAWLERVPDSTVVVTRVCDSACVVIFAAARTRLVEREAVFGVHSPQCRDESLLGWPCRLFWEPWARGEFRARVAHASAPWAGYLDAQEPPAFTRAGTDVVRVTGAQLIAFGAAAPLTATRLRAAIDGP